MGSLKSNEICLLKFHIYKVLCDTGAYLLFIFLALPSSFLTFTDYQNAPYHLTNSLEFISMRIRFSLGLPRLTSLLFSKRKRNQLIH